MHTSACGMRPVVIHEWDVGIGSPLLELVDRRVGLATTHREAQLFAPEALMYHGLDLQDYFREPKPCSDSAEVVAAAEEF